MAASEGDAGGAGDAAAILLYWAPDNASLIIRMVLEELGAAYETRLVDRRRREHEGEAYRRMNPSGLIPVCVIDGAPVHETAAIALALAERFGRLAPGLDDPSRPQFLKWLFFLSNTLHPDLRQLFYPAKFVGEDAAMIEAHRRLTRARLERSFAALDAHYAAERHGDEGAPYLLGAAPCVVDLYLAACLRWAQIYPMAAPGQLRSADYPALERMAKALEARPAIARACAAEGVNAPFFTAPGYATPKEGSAL